MTTKTVEQPKTEIAEAAAKLVANAEFIQVPYGQLVESPLNVRAGAKLVNIPELAEEIVLAGGLIQNLAVIQRKGSKKNQVTYEVVAGRRRHAALDWLFENGRISQDFPVAVRLVTEEQALYISLSENRDRENMHVYYQIRAFKLLADKGDSIASIALQFRVTPLTVQRHLKLANMSPKLFELLREDELTLEQMQVLALTEDHALQEKIWFESGSWNRNPSQLRALITQQETKANSNRKAKLVGLEAYRNAGGAIREDIFGGPDDVYICDLQLLQQLADAKLQAEVDTLQAAGWKWVEVRPNGFDDEHKFGVHPGTLRELPAEQQQEYERMQARLDEVNADINKLEQEADEDMPEEEYEARWQVLGEECEALESKLNAIDAERKELDRSTCGAVVFVDAQGQIQLRTGLMRGEEIRAAKKEGVTIQNGSGYEVRTPKDKAVHSERLVNKLTADMTIAVQAELIAQPAIALAVLTHRLLCDEFGSRCQTLATKINLHTTKHKLAQDNEEIKATPAYMAREEARDKWKAKFPQGYEKSIDWLLDWKQSELIDLLAFLTAASVDGMAGTEEERTGLDAVAKVTNLDMRKWWQPTASSYFSHVNKQRIQDVVAEAVSPEAALPIGGMKKAEAAEYAEGLLAGKGWLPQVMNIAN